MVHMKQDLPAVELEKLQAMATPAALLADDGILHSLSSYAYGQQVLNTRPNRSNDPVFTAQSSTLPSEDSSSRLSNTTGGRIRNAVPGI